MNIKKKYIALIMLSCSFHLQGSKAHQLNDISNQIHAFHIQDQKLRKTLTQKNMNDEKIKHKINKIDKKSSKFIHEILSTYGWPDRSKVSAQTYHEFMTLILHSPDEKLLQQVFVHVLHDFLHDEGSDYQYFALYIDKVFTRTYGYQIFGTQLNGQSDDQNNSIEIWNKRHVDKRRKQLNLMPLSVYKEMTNHFYSEKNKHVSKNL